MSETAASKWAPENSFDHLKQELLAMDPVYFAESHLMLDGKPMRLMGNGWKFIADIYRHIVTAAMTPSGKPIVMVKGRQVGATVMGTALELYMMTSGMFGKSDTSPVRVMHVFPHLDNMRAFAKDKLEKMIRESVSVPDPHARKPGELKPFVETRKDTARDSTDSLKIGRAHV